MKNKLLTERQLLNFWSKVKKTRTCWLWMGAKTWKGYGQLSLFHFPHRAHKVSWSLANNMWVPENGWILHTCDNKSCVKPEHLYLGDQKQNVKDAVERKRLRYGSNHPGAKLVENQVTEIRRLLTLKIPGAAIGRKYGVSDQAIYDIANGHHWRHV